MVSSQCHQYPIRLISTFFGECQRTLAQSCRAIRTLPKRLMIAFREMVADLPTCGNTLQTRNGTECGIGTMYGNCRQAIFMVQHSLLFIGILLTILNLTL